MSPELWIKYLARFFMSVCLSVSDAVSLYQCFNSLFLICLHFLKVDYKISKLPGIKKKPILDSLSLIISYSSN